MVTVTGSDESGPAPKPLAVARPFVDLDRQPATKNLNSNPRVNVDDAPEVEAWWDFKGRLGPHPSTLNLAGEGNPEATQNAAPFTKMAYAVRPVEPPGARRHGDGDGDGAFGQAAPHWPVAERVLPMAKLGGCGVQGLRRPVRARDAANWHGLRKTTNTSTASGNKQTVTGEASNSETWDNSADTPWRVLRAGSM